MNDLSPSPLIGRAEPLAQQLAAALRREIVEGAVAPGTHLSVPELARRFAVSRTPAREGLLILEREGLVGRQGGAGMRVLGGDTAKLVELLEMREVLEGLAARRAATRMDAATRAELDRIFASHRVALREQGLDAHVEHDTAFHALIQRAADSGILAEQLERIDRIAQALNRALSAGEGFDVEVVELDHGRIVAAMAARNPDDAERAARAHVRRVIRFLKAQRGE
jgi:DNA-binding GntR family transcriptional regulator